jgi:uncharacterized protein YdeI (YjbR/CyaY-like superfamily)
MDAEFFATAGEFEAWLEANGADADEVLVRMAKKHTGVASLDWAGAVDVALCFGWIDGRSKRIDDDWFVQRFTPRRPQSTWSKVNRQKVEALIAAGRMRPAGLAEIERAKADGRWQAAYDGMATSAVPEDLAAALEAAGLTDAFAELSRRTATRSCTACRRPRRPRHASAGSRSTSGCSRQARRPTSTGRQSQRENRKSLQGWPLRSRASTRTVTPNARAPPERIVRPRIWD